MICPSDIVESLHKWSQYVTEGLSCSATSLDRTLPLAIIQVRQKVLVKLPSSENGSGSGYDDVVFVVGRVLSIAGENCSGSTLCRCSNGNTNINTYTSACSCGGPPFNSATRRVKVAYKMKMMPVVSEPSSISTMASAHCSTSIVVDVPISDIYDLAR